jgi:glucokinase
VKRAPAVVADVGGTTARFAALGADGSPGEPLELASRDFPGLEGALAAAFERLGSASAVAVAVAGPVVGDEVELTNVGWAFSIERTRTRLGLDRLVVVNDFAALARSLPALPPGAFETIRAGEPRPERERAPWAVLGPGTGLGVAGLVPVPDGWQVLPGEGGHRDLAATEELEWRVVERLAARYGHVSAERALSGPGLVALHEAVCELDGRPCRELDPAGVAEAARGAGDDAAAARSACGLFSGWLGAFAGDVALTLGARAGVVLAGGVLAGLGPAFDRRRFVERFLGKGRFAAWLEPVPVLRLLDPVRAALRGAALLLD